ncbi:mycothiol system anti-sigma-R factor [Egibacter rhizosphaerae]|uniref:Mycothiol system anti-sigma-R factor n=1 Tax=Egibacter rhizosphaerae TaxID=1670831 RepID=A0A411YDF7_9ACTN|nr:mycothiol system anti-sigma-R factor [Egibacter rhizosphaerae]QBI19187.1 mycothiol system anti-sigma-R factor [Egibacter rhizosphaerae]
MKDHCERILADLSAYLDDECPQDVAQVLADHLADCPPCLERADFERQVRALLASKCREAAPPELFDRVIGRLGTNPRLE